MKFYGRFASAYGTLMIVPVAASMLTRSHINLGMLGYYGFPVIALAYAIVRYAVEENPVLFAFDTDESINGDEPA